MNISVILGHPQPGSFNHAIAQTVVRTLTQNGHTAWSHDLYAEQFDPILPAGEIPKEAALDAVIQQHCDEITRAEGIVIVHPNWWGQPPAILKGWVDRVIRPGVAYAFMEGDGGEGVPVGLLRAHTAVVFNTANTPEKREIEVFGDPLHLLWKNCVFDLCGVSTFYRTMYRVIITSSPEQRRVWLHDVEEIVDRFFPTGC
ncbi:MAG: NAD(P)H-dependent oxidoreductase [Anaerolineae bacterium]|nr:NAD(P)H-dependent oxidoreductase [Anaerolineae bacterium]